MAASETPGAHWLSQIRDALAPFVSECLNETDRETARPWWETVDSKRKGKGLRALPRDLTQCRPDELLLTMSTNWPAFAFKTKLRFENPKTARPFDHTPKGWVDRLYELRNAIMHQDTVTADDVDDFLRCAELLLRTSKADKIADQMREIKELLRSHAVVKETPEVQPIDAARASNVAEQHVQTPESSSPTSALVVHQISDPTQPEFELFLELLRDEFDEAVRDPDEDLERWLRDSEEFKAQKPSCHDYFLMAKFDGDNRVGGNIAGLVYASNYPTLGYLFVSYIAINHKLAKQLHDRGEFRLEFEIRHNAMDLLLRALAEKTEWGNGVIAEIAHDEKNAALKRVFRSYASRFFDARLYQFGITYPPSPVKAG